MAIGKLQKSFTLWNYASGTINKKGRVDMAVTCVVCGNDAAERLFNSFSRRATKETERKLMKYGETHLVQGAVCKKCAHKHSDEGEV